jgi:signal transduction histidine kinase
MNDNFYILIIISVAGIGLIITGFILLQVRNQNKLLQKQKQIAAAEIAHQKALLQAVITSQETERQRIGNDLHDEVGAVLSSLRMLIEKNNEQEQHDAAAMFTSQSKEMIDSVIRNVRQISHNLSPRISGNFGFYDALLELCDTVNASGTIQLQIDFPESQIPAALDTNTAIAVYRVLAELINNTIKHARAKQISIRISTAGNTMQLYYADDGIGFAYNEALATKGMGLQNIESRLSMIQAGWTMQEENTRGFNISIAVPVN